MAEALNIVVLTVSDTRTAENDTSGDYLVEALTQQGHQLLGRSIVIDDIYRLRLAVSESIADPDAQVILLTGGTGFTGRDSTPEAIGPLLDTRIDGFGELFRQLSYSEIGTSIASFIISASSSVASERNFLQFSIINFIIYPTNILRGVFSSIF